MNRFLWVFICASLLLPGWAAAQANCAYGANGFADGCALANPNGAFQVSAAQFASNQSGVLPDGLAWSGALQSGQTWTSAHPWPWDAPGIDYPVGYDTTIALQDPAKAAVGTGVGQLPPACRYISNPNFPNTGGMRVYCGPAASITIAGFDFSLHGCIALQFASNFTGTAIVTNNKFSNGPNCSINNGSMVNVASATSFTFKNNVVLGNGATVSNGMTLILDNAKTGSATNEYNYYYDAPNRVFTSNRMNVSNLYNYISGLNTKVGTGLHGEVGIAPGQSGATYTNSFNVVMFDTSSQLNTTSFYMTSTLGFQLASADHNVIVSNKTMASGTSAANVSALLAEMNPTFYRTLTIVGNYGDPTGALSCIYMKGGTVGTLNLSGNVSLVTGLPMNTIGAVATHPGCR
ncbi:MAG: hypothetical protein JWO83_3557 [Caulobacteraceae bacterium]|nr:hypothetical protein [Caulobacteraceae bacterium]